MLSHGATRAVMAVIRMWLAAAMLFTALTSAHMAMMEPPPINHKSNPHTVNADVDYSSPLSPSGSNYPCRGHLKDLSGPAGASVRSYQPGGTYPIGFEGSAVHGGGSCQAALSYDGGQSWSVIKSWIGNCPNANAPNTPFEFQIPNNAPSGTAVFAWTWFNRIGNREMYMNCAVVTIGGGGSRKPRNKARALSGPEIFLANIGNGCSTTEGTDVVFPNPGENVQTDSAARQAPPSGNCGGGNYQGGGATGGSPYQGGNENTGGNNGGENPGAGDEGNGGGEAQPVDPGAGAGQPEPEPEQPVEQPAEPAPPQQPQQPEQPEQPQEPQQPAPPAQPQEPVQPQPQPAPVIPEVGQQPANPGTGQPVDSGSGIGAGAGNGGQYTPPSNQEGTQPITGNDGGWAQPPNGGNGAIEAPPVGSKGCEYWEAQGYICSAASENRSPLLLLAVALAAVGGALVLA